MKTAAKVAGFILAGLSLCSMSNADPETLSSQQKQDAKKGNVTTVALGISGAILLAAGFSGKTAQQIGENKEDVVPLPIKDKTNRLRVEGHKNA